MRYLLCTQCSEAGKLTLVPDDKAIGFQERRVAVAKSVKPPDLSRSIITVKDDNVTRSTEMLEQLECDSCGAKIPAGSPVTCVTHWCGREPAQWEVMYGAT